MTFLLDNIGVSIVIPAFNARFIKDTLEALANQDCSGFEVIVVENGVEKPRLYDLLKIYQPVLDIHYIFQEAPGLNNARNEGVKISRNNIIALTDDDCIPRCDWVRNVRHAHNIYSDASVIGGRVVLQPIGGEFPIWFLKPLRAYLAELNMGDFPKELSSQEEYLVGANFSFRKEVFELVGGFPREIGIVGNNFQGNDELAFINKAKENGFKKLVYFPEMEVFHQIPPERRSVDYLMKRAYGQGISDAKLILLNPNSDIISFLQNNLFGQEWNWEEMNREQGRLDECFREEFRKNYMGCRISYLHGIKDFVFSIMGERLSK